MLKRVICPECESECEIDNKSVREGNREFEDYKCPDCGYVLDTLFTDQLPNVRLTKKGRSNKMMNQ